MTRPFLAAALLLLGVLATRPASGAPSNVSEPRANDTCFGAALDGQKLRNGGKLGAARAQLIICSSPTCPAAVAEDCTQWLAEVNAAMPTIVLGARDASGADLVDVSVAVDGAPVGTTSEGRPVSVDPGRHEAVFTRAGRITTKETFIARAGEKNRAVVARFAAETVVSTAPPDPEPASRRVPVASWALGGASVVALGVLTYFGAKGISDRSRLGCDVGCAASDKRSVDAEFLVADVALGVAVAALAAAVVLYLAQPAQPQAARARSILTF
jgi:hypothetical protein